MKTCLLSCLLAAVVLIGCGSTVAPSSDVAQERADAAATSDADALSVCAGGETRCAGSCVDLQQSAQNCGACGVACVTGATCIAGACVAPPCMGPLVRCGMQCVDPMHDNANCGACGHACSPGTTCSMAGACVALMCSPSETPCAGVCADTTSDAMNCGACGFRCPIGTTCIASVCAPTCSTPLALCGDACVNLSTDVHNCGGCSIDCARGTTPVWTCRAGQCACESGLVTCGAACTNVLNDPANCGTCGNACPPGASCSAGTCAPTLCPSPQVRCGGACVDTNGDASNCGVCAHACAAGTMCSLGVCGAPACPGTTTSCGGTCVDTSSDANNCGGCARSCPTGSSCVAGHCGRACPSGQTACSTTCVDITSDNSNCGACGAACGPSTYCQGSTCLMLGGTFTVAPSTITWVDACAAAGAQHLLADTDNCTAGSVPIPFSFGFWTATYESIVPSPNGFISFGMAPTCFIGPPVLPFTTDAHPAAYAYGRDLIQRSGVCVATIGATPNRMLVVETVDAMHAGAPASHLTFELILHETSNVIDVVYQTLMGTDTTGAGSVVGLEDGSGTLAAQYERFSPGSLHPGLAIRFSPSM